MPSASRMGRSFPPSVLRHHCTECSSGASNGPNARNDGGFGPAQFRERFSVFALPNCTPCNPIDPDGLGSGHPVGTSDGVSVSSAVGKRLTSVKRVYGLGPLEALRTHRMGMRTRFDRVMHAGWKIVLWAYVGYGMGSLFGPPLDEGGWIVRLVLAAVAGWIASNYYSKKENE